MGTRALVPFPLLVVLLLASCGDDADQGVNTASGVCAGGEEAGPYFLYEDPDWEFRGATDYAADVRPLEAAEPGLDWTAEYERLTPSSDGATVEGASLRLSGHEVDLATLRRELPGFRTDEADVAGRPAYTGVSPEGAPTLVGLAIDPGYTVMLLSYGLDLDELVRIAESVEQVCQPEWLAAGGEVLDCNRFEPGCTAASSTTEPGISTTPAPS